MMKDKDLAMFYSKCVIDWHTGKLLVPQTCISLTTVITCHWPWTLDSAPVSVQTDISCDLVDAVSVMLSHSEGVQEDRVSEFKRSPHLIHNWSSSCESAGE